MYRPEKLMERIIAEASVEQRAVLGFPAPGHPYWNRDTVSAVEARYAAWSIDMTPYRESL